MKIDFHPDVIKQLQRLPRAEFETALHHIVELSHDPRPHGAKMLVGSTNDWRIRFGQYRIVYSIDDQKDTATIYRVAKRSEAYR